MAGLLGLPLQVQAQSGPELYRQANTLKKKGSCEDARQAIKLYNRAKKAESNLRVDCDKNIQKCQAIIKKDCNVSLDITQEVVEIPYQGGESQIGVISSKKWDVEGIKEWFTTRVGDKKDNFIVSCLDQNNSTRERTTTLTVKSGDLFKSLKVVQAARPEYIEVDATSLAFPSKGTTELIGVESNANWEVRSAPSWCKVEKGDSTIRIIVQPNDRVMERPGDIIIASPNKSVTIKISQGAGEEHLTLSQNNIILPAEGGKHYMKVYTDAENWFLGDFPSWLNVERVGSDSICIMSGKNEPNGQERSGSVQVKTDRQTTGLFVTQAARQAVDLIFGENRVNGNNISLGVSASYYMPFVSTSASGDFIGSLVDYSLGNSLEDADYNSAVGYSFGLFADIRLYQNIYLMAGVNFSQIKYKNTFAQNTSLIVPYNSYQYMKGDVQNSYTEDYTHTMIEVPILASYRFPINNVSHVQLNLGPVLNFGLSSKMKFSGNTDSETMLMYNRFTDKQAGISNYPRHTMVDAEFNLYQPCVSWTESYTTGNVGIITDHHKFTESPFHRFNCGLRAGVGYEIAGLSFGLYYTMMLTNMANKGYWENKRWTVLNESDQLMSGYKHRIHTLEFRLAYTLRYLGMNKNK